MPSDLIQEFEAIHARMKAILDRRAIVAHNPHLDSLQERAAAGEDPRGVLIARKYFEQEPGTQLSEWFHPIATIEADCQIAWTCRLQLASLGPRIKAAVIAARDRADQQAAKRLGLL